MSDSYLEIQLDQQPIELYKLLKIANLVSGGGEAKIVISEGYVFLNGEVEYQKRKKVYHNDIVEFNGETLQIIVDENLENEFVNNNEVQPVQSQNPSDIVDKQKSKITLSADTESTSSNSKKHKRKPISF